MSYVGRLSWDHRRRLGEIAWTPASPTTGGYSPEHWYRSDDAYQEAARSTVCANDGDAVGSWTDQASAADHVSQADAAKKPTWQNGAGDQLNGHPVLRSDGSNDYLSGAFTNGGSMSQPNTIFVVAKLLAGGVDNNVIYLLMDGDDSAHRATLAKDSGGDPDNWGINAGAALSGGDADANWNIWTVLFNGASSQFWTNGVSEGSGNAGAHAQDGIMIGALFNGGYSWPGDYVEFLLYDANLSDVDKNQVGQYLASRYGLSYTDIA